MRRRALDRNFTSPPRVPATAMPETTVAAVQLSAGVSWYRDDLVQVKAMIHSVNENGRPGAGHEPDSIHEVFIDGRCWQIELWDVAQVSALVGTISSRCASARKLSDLGNGKNVDLARAFVNGTWVLGQSAGLAWRRQMLQAGLLAVAERDYRDMAHRCAAAATAQLVAGRGEGAVLAAHRAFSYAVAATEAAIEGELPSDCAEPRGVEQLDKLLPEGIFTPDDYRRVQFMSSLDLDQPADWVHEALRLTAWVLACEHRWFTGVHVDRKRNKV